MKKFEKHIATLFSLALSLLLISCQDDFGYYGPGNLEGETEVALELSYMPFSEGLLTRSENAGNILKPLKDLSILVYDKSGNLLKDYCQWNVPTSGAQNTDRPSDESGGASNGGKPAESATLSLTGVRMKLPFGKYYIVGVANLKGGTETTLKANENAISTLSGLRRLRVSWNDDDISKNGEMLGFFTDAENKIAPNSNSQFQLVSVARPGMTLHTWLRRCASKITIDFDGSQLRDNVYVYIKEARIVDIASDCSLGFGSVADYELNNSETTPTYNNVVKKVEDGVANMKTSSKQRIDFRTKKESDNHNDGWPVITKGQPNIVDENSQPFLHNEDATALYFYENMQGIKPEPGKMQIPNTEDNGTPSGGLSYYEKDEVPYGTYIEVEGYYHSDADKNIANGKIIYRFMLGQNVTDDFNAERNYHYKLTLKLRGNGNDYDWHIDFQETKGFNVPNPWYVSYLYNHDATLPFKYVPEDDWEVVGLKADIIQNPWYPSDISQENLTNPTIEIKPKTPTGDLADTYSNDGVGDKSTWNKNAYNYDEIEKFNKADGHGFLSLRVTNKPVITLSDVGLTEFLYDNKNGGQDKFLAANYEYYRGLNSKGNGIDRSTRTYLENGEVVPLTDQGELSQIDKDREIFTMVKDGDAMSFGIPLFTRAKVMVKESGYSGNNPFVGYQRVARVKLTVTLRHKDGGTKTVSQNVNVVQVRRVVNPKGVYRRAGNNEPFHVKMMWLAGDGAREFDEVISHGPWKAEIIGDANFITLDGRQTVSGATETPVDFRIRFNRMNSAEDKTVRNAVVRIKYHNYTCTHLIFVRQGYEPQELMPAEDCIDGTGSATPVKWNIGNMIARNVQATDPRDEGSMFKFGNSYIPIDAINNVYRDNSGKELHHNLKKEDFDSYMNSALGPFIITKSDGSIDINAAKTKWDPKTFKKDDSGFTSGDMKKTATMRHFEQLYLSSHMSYGYGVLYADGATETQESLDMAYGYYRRDTPSGDSPKGMRGLFVYHYDGNAAGDSEWNGRNIFFPIGRSGYGHRKNTLDVKNEEGILRYACRRGVSAPDVFDDSGPIFTSIFRRPGAIYWARNTETDFKGWDGEKGDGTAYGLDINYFSFDVNAITHSNVDSGNDACFVRCVTE